MSVAILKAGVLDTVQDTGRYGFAKWGVNPGGAMDLFACRIASALVGNTEQSPVIEMHFPAPAIRFEDDALISITGAEFSPNHAGTVVPMWKPVIVRKGSVLTFARKIKGERAYLALAGDLDIRSWLESYSTSLRAQAGGMEGRKLKSGDVIPLKSLSVLSADAMRWSVNPAGVYISGDIRFVPGPQFAWLSEESREQMCSTQFFISSASDRMACQLEHTGLALQAPHQLLSTAVVFGTIQALPTGRLIVLMADHQTTGGYPIVGHVVTADLPRFAQMSAGTSFRFARIEHDQAEKMVISLEQDVRHIREQCLARINKHLDANH